MLFGCIIFYGLVGRFSELGELYAVLIVVNLMAIILSTLIVLNFKLRGFVNSFLINLFLAGLFFTIGNFFADSLRYEVIESVVVESVDADGTSQAVGIRVFEYSGWEFLWIFLAHAAFAYLGYFKLKSDTDDASNFSDEIFKVKLGNKLYFLPFKDIEFIEASGNYVNIYSNEKKYTSRIAINDMLRQADKSYLMRIHRSFAININQIRELTTNGEGHAVVLTNGSKVKVGKHYKENLFNHLGISQGS